MALGLMSDVGRPSRSAFWAPVERHSSTELDEALNGRLLSEAGKTLPTGFMFESTTFMPVRLPSRSRMSVFLSPSLNLSIPTRSV
jgi:hypothetical protein